MSILSLFQIHTSSVFVTTSLLVMTTAFGWAEGPDPTTPSPSITERLTSEDEAVRRLQPSHDGVTKGGPLLLLRLKGIVLRDSDNGTALVALGDSELHVVTLRRTTLHSAAEVLNIGGMSLAVKNFSESRVVLQNVDTDQQFVIN